MDVKTFLTFFILNFKKRVLTFFIFPTFLPRDASAERGDATVSCPSVRPSVCDV